MVYRSDNSEPAISQLHSRFHTRKKVHPINALQYDVLIYLFLFNKSLYLHNI